MSERDPNILVNLGANTSDFDAKIQRSTRNLDGMRESSGELVASMTALGAAGLAAGGAMLALARQASENAVEIIALANAANASTDQFQRMAAGAKTLHIEQDKLSDILKDTTEHIGEFISTASGPVADFFERLAPQVGITADEFRNLSGPEALQKYFNALEQANLSQDRMTFYMEQLASDSSKLAPLLRNNGEEFRKLGDRAQEFGGVISAMDLQKLAQSDVEWQKVSATIERLKNMLAIELLPGVNRFLEMTISGFNKLVEAKNHISSAVNDIKAALSGEAINHLLKERLVLQNQLNELNAEYTKWLIESESLSEEEQLTVGETYRKKQEQLNLEKEILDERIKALDVTKAEREILTIPVTNSRAGGQSEPSFVMPPMIPLDIPATEPPDFEAERQREIQATLAKYQTVQEMTSAHNQEMLNLELAYSEGLISTKAELNEKLRMADEQYQAQLTAQMQSGAASREAFERMTMSNRVKLVSSSLAQMTAGVANHNKTLFNINKAAGISEAIINGITGVSKTLATYPFPWNVPMAAAHALVAVAQVRQIQSATYGGGGGGAGIAPSQANVPATPVAAAGGGGGTSGPQSTLFVEGLNRDSLFSGDAVAGIAKKLLDFQRNGGQVVLSA